MKRIVLVICFFHIAFVLRAGEVNVAGIWYELDINGKTASVSNIKRQHQYSGFVTIPSRISYSGVNYQVTEIGREAFWGCDKLTYISIPSSITTIGYSAFRGCSNLKTIVIPKSVNYIGGYAFYECTRLDKIYILGTNIKLGTNDTPFFGLTSNIYVPDSEKNKISGGRDFKGAVLTCTEKKIKSLSKEDDTLGDKTNSNKINKTKDLPLLTFVDNSLKFIDINANKTLDANEACKICFQMINKGKGPASGCKVKIRMKGTTSGVKCADMDLPSIAIGSTQTVEIPINTGVDTQDGQVTFSIEVTEPNGFGIDPMTLTVNTHAFEAPLLKVVDYAVSGNGILKKKEPFKLQLLLQNTKYGTANDVDVTILLPDGVMLWDGESSYHFARLQGGEKKDINIQLAASGNYTGSSIPVKVIIKEKHGRFAENRTIDLQLNQQLASSTSVVLQGERPIQEQREAIQIGALGSDVDRNIPTTKIKNSNTFAVIIANEQYQQVANVPYALNDGNIFAQYCEKTLGISPKHIRYVSNATLNQIKAQVSWLQNMTDAWDDARVIFYYTGHGIPDERNRTSYLLPVDGYGTDISTGYKLDDLYAALGNMPANHITVFMDACFSGAQRSGEMLASAKGVVLKVKAGTPQGNMVVFSAAQADETAMFYNSQQHGLFTYYLLKKLQESKGDVDLHTLGDYIYTNVRRTAMDENDKPQTPTVTPATAVVDEWGNWKLK